MAELADIRSRWEFSRFRAQANIQLRADGEGLEFEIGNGFVWSVKATDLNTCLEAPFLVRNY
jgi:hypothetical protein